LLVDIGLLLQDGDLECLSFINNLRSIPGSEELIQQMEEIDFTTALETLEEISRSLGPDDDA